MTTMRGYGWMNGVIERRVHSLYYVERSNQAESVSVVEWMNVDVATWGCSCVITVGSLKLSSYRHRYLTAHSFTHLIHTTPSSSFSKRAVAVICKQYVKHGYYFSGPNVLHIQRTLTQLQLSTSFGQLYLMYGVYLLTHIERLHLLHAVRCVMLALKLMKWLTAVPCLRAKCYSSQSMFH